MVSYSQLRKLIEDHYKPLIAVESSNFAEQACKRVGLSTIQLLRYFPLIYIFTPSPYAAQDNLMTSIKFENRSVPVDRISFYLEYTEEIKHLDETKIEEYLLQTLILRKPSTDTIHQMIRDFCNGKLTYDINQEWLLDFTSSLLNSCRFGEYNLLFHPLGVLLIVSSDDPDPILRFDELSQRVLHYPRFSMGMYNKAIPFFYILLHDTSSRVDVDDLLRRMKSSFNASQCKVIRFNSDTKESLDWADDESSPSFALSAENEQNVREIMQSVISKSVLPNLQKLIESYTQAVIADRRGFVNSVFSWLRNSSSSNILATNQEEELVLYHRDTIEFKIRFLADMAFLFHVCLLYVFVCRTTSLQSITTK